MKTTNRLYLFLLLFCALAGPATRAADSNTACRLVLELTDGSRVIGTPQIATLPLQTDFAKVDVPLERVRSVKFAADHVTATVTLANGDRLQGRLALAPLALETCFGRVSIALALVGHLSVSRDRAAAAGAGLVLHYTFDEEDGDKVTDRSGRGHDGLIVGNARRERSFRGQAIRIGGPRSYVVCDAKELNADGWTEFTACAWVLLKGGRTPYGPVITRGEVTGPRGGLCHLGTGGPYGDHWNAGVMSACLQAGDPVTANPKAFAREANPQPAQDVWYHCALTYDGQTVCSYINGQLDTSMPVEPARRQVRDWPNTKLVIGSAATTPFIDWADQFFDGLIDEVRVYNRALSAEDIRHLHDTDKQAQRLPE